MPPSVTVAVHPSQFPDQLENALKRSLRRRQLEHKFHYQSFQQAEKWRALHLAHHPDKTDPTYASVYRSGFAATAQVLGTDPVQVIGLCCGYGEKESQLLAGMQSQGVFFLACDGGLPLVLLAAQAASKIIRPENCARLLCDVQTASDLPEHIPFSNSRRRLVTFFGSVHNFEPDLIFPRLAALLRPNDLLLLSANLAPEADSYAALSAIVPQYQNPLTFDWLMQLLLDLGFSRDDGTIRVVVEPCPVEPGLQRVAIYFEFLRSRSIKVLGESFEFHDGETIRLFFSYRYTPALLGDWLARSGFSVLDKWITRRQEEGVWLCKREALGV